MARELSRFGRGRSSRFGQAPSSVFHAGQAPVLKLNQGATTLGRKATLPLNKPGGGFGSGFPAGGNAIAAALGAGSQGPSVAGSPEVGPSPSPRPVGPGPAPRPPLSSFPTSFSQPLPGNIPTTFNQPSFPSQFEGILEALSFRPRRRGGGLFAI